MLKRLFVFCILLTGVGVLAQAEETACTGILQEITAYVPVTCDATGRNQICYGNPNIIAEAQADVDDFQFSAIGDIEDVLKVKSLRLSALDTSRPEWGVTLLRLQTNLPDTMPGENVTFLMFGDTRLLPAYVPVELPATILGEQSVNIRQAPTTGAPVLGTASGGTQVTATGITANGEWLRVKLSDGTQGWIASFLASVDGDVATLNEVSSGDIAYAPVQAIYFSSGIGDRPCYDVPDSGLLIQTPKGAGQIHFMINEVSIVVGSTLFVQAMPDDYLYIYVLEGQIEVTAFDVTKIVPEGAFVTVPIDDDLKAIGAPEDVQPYADMDFEALPIMLLPDPIEIADPVTEADLAELEQCTGLNESAINTRSGPGTGYGSSGLNAGETSTITGKAEGTDGFVWYQVEGDQWIRSDLLTLSGDCSAVPTITDIPLLPTPIPVVESDNTSTEQTSQSSSTVRRTGRGPVWFEVRPCENLQLQAGDLVRFGNGGGTFASPEEAEAGYAGSSAVIILDGQPLSVTQSSVDFWEGSSDSPAGYTKTSSADWVATPGIHTFIGYWTHWDYEPHTCTFTVSE